MIQDSESASPKVEAFQCSTSRSLPLPLLPDDTNGVTDYLSLLSLQSPSYCLLQPFREGPVLPVRKGDLPALR